MTSLSATFEMSGMGDLLALILTLRVVHPLDEALSLQQPHIIYQRGSSIAAPFKSAHGRESESVDVDQTLMRRLLDTAT